ncbi:MAG: SDR family oxidoreductase [Actinobacteria bacterium]|nr:SDR family oxidoreductase [Actinomycetota bacterium]
MPTALVTGGSKGFGLAIATRLIAEGWTVITNGRDPEALAAAASALQDRDGKLVVIPGDVSDPGHRALLVEAVDSFWTLDLLVNNASSLGQTPLPGLDRYPLSQLERVFQVNVIAPLALAQTLLPNLTAVNGTIVNISSDAATQAYEGWGGYGASKAALDQISAVLGVEQEALHIYAFDPGDMRTEMHQAAFPGEDISDRPEPEKVVPAFMKLIDDLPPSGRYRASELAPDLEPVAS